MILELEAQNFLSFKYLKLNFPETGLINITGMVKDSSFTNSNGAGKTAILDLIIWTLFGYNRRGLADGVIKNNSTEGTFGRIVFISKQRAYEVIRYRKHPKFKNSTSIRRIPEDLPISKTDNDYAQEVINKILGVDLDVFLRCFLFDTTLTLATIKDNDAKILFEKLIGMSFSEYHAKAKQKLKQVADDQIKISTELEINNRTLFSQTTQLKKYQEEEAEWAIKNKTTLDALKTHLEIINKENNELTNQIKENNTALLDHNKKYDEYMEQLNSYLQVTSSSAQNQKILAELNVQINNLTAQINQMPTIPTLCPTCGQTLTKWHIEKIAMDHQTKIKSLQEERSELEKKKQSIIVVDTTIPPALMTQINKIRGHIDLLTNEIQLKTTKLNENNLRIGQIQSQIINNINPYTKTIENIQSNIKLTQNEITTLTAKRADIDKLVSRWDFIVEMFSPKGLKSYVMDIIIPYINSYLSSYLYKITNDEIKAGFYINNETNKFSITINRTNGGDTYESLSQGEKSRLNFCLILAVFTYLQQVTGHSLLIFDELMDGLDSTGVELVMTLLQTIAQKTQVIIISHNQSIQQYANCTINVIKENGTSTINTAYGQYTN